MTKPAAFTAADFERCTMVYSNSRAPATVVTFTAAEIETCRARARQRQGAKTRVGITRSRYGNLGDRDDHDQWQPHFFAAKAEVAVARLTGGTIDTTVSTRGNKRGNVTLADGRNAVVKYRTRRGWDLALYGSTMASFRGDVAFLVWPATKGSGDDMPMEVVGWIDRETFSALAVLVDLNTGRERLLLTWKCLRPLTELYGKTTQDSLFTAGDGS